MGNFIIGIVIGLLITFFINVDLETAFTKVDDDQFRTVCKEYLIASKCDFFLAELNALEKVEIEVEAESNEE